MNKKAIILINLGTPSELSVPAIRKFLNQFLMDWRVVSIPFIWRWLLVNIIIKPRRPRKIKHNYKSIWLKSGSPLIYYAKSLTNKLKLALNGKYNIDFAMRYGDPAIKDVLLNQIKKGTNEILIVPLFPQYASATIGSLNEEIYKSLKNLWHSPTIKFLAPYYDKDFFITAQANLAKKFIKNKYDYYLFSYHGLPVSHLHRGETENNICQINNQCCAKINASNSYCYRAQAYQTTKALCQQLKINPNKALTVFQSRFGKDPWIEPFLDKTVQKLADAGAKNLLVFSPSFTADCIETLEEIAIGVKNSFLKSGGNRFDLVPAVNDSKLWVSNLAKNIAENFV